MGRRPGNGLFDRKEVMDLMQQRLDGSIKSLRELKDRIAEETGEQIALTTLWQQIHKMRGEPMEHKPGHLRIGSTRPTRFERTRIVAKMENDGGDVERSDYSEAVGTMSLRRSARAAKRRDFSPSPSPTGGFEMKKQRLSVTTESTSNISLYSSPVNELRIPKRKIIRRKKLDEPKHWDKNAEELIRLEALRHEAETADDPLAKAKSKVWLFCEKFDEGGESKAKCKICGMVMLRRLGSTRAMLRHLRKMHDNLIEGIIRPITKRVTAIAGKPRADDGFDIDDDSAWVEEVDEEDFDDYDEQRYAPVQHCVGKGKVIAYNNYNGEEGPSYGGEVFLRHDGSYADGDEIVDVVYVQDENSLEDIMSKSNDETGFANNNIGSLETRSEGVATPSRLKRSISDSELAQPPSKNGRSGPERYIGTNLETADSRSMENLNVLGRERQQQENHEFMREEHFGRLITESIRAFPPEQREHVRCAIMQCIDELRNAGSADETGISEVTEDELVQITDV